MSFTLVSHRFSVAAGCCAPCCVVPLWALRRSAVLYYPLIYLCILLASAAWPSIPCSIHAHAQPHSSIIECPSLFIICSPLYLPHSYPLLLNFSLSSTLRILPARLLVAAVCYPCPAVLLLCLLGLQGASYLPETYSCPFLVSFEQAF